MGQDTWIAYQQQLLGLAQSLGVRASVLSALGILVAGWLLALLGRSLAKRLVRGGAGLLSAWTSVASAHSERAQRMVGSVVYWGVLLLSVMAATETLGLPVVTSWLSKVASFVPRVIAAVLIVALGTLVSKVVRRIVSRAASSASLSGAERLGRVAEVALLVATALVAIEQLGVEVSFLKTTLLVVLAAGLGGAALAFGLGSRALVENVLSAHYVQRAYQVGQTIRVEDVEGRIVRMTEVFVVVETADGQVTIPASQITSSRATLVLKAGAR